MTKKSMPSAKLSFWACFASTVFLSKFFPLFFFAPYLIIVAYQKDRVQALWRAILCGLIIDLLSSSYPFGFHVLNYTITLWFLYFLTRFLFEDKFSTLPVMSMLFSQVAIILYPVLSLLLSHPFPIDGRSFFVDLFLISFFEILYVLLFFSFPFRITQRLIRLRSL